jgi:hypothetical protein
VHDTPLQADTPKEVTDTSIVRAGLFIWIHRASTLLAIAGLVAVVSWVTIPRLPPGICFDDWGDIQLASATLGIAHPPGYPGYATIGYLLTRIPGVDPAYAITIACFVAGLSVLIAYLLLQQRLGTNVWFAVAICFVLAAHPRFWINLRAPEVYMPTLALVTWSIFFLLHYQEKGRRRSLFTAVLLFAVSLGNRPPVLLAAPFFLIAWGYAGRRWHAGGRTPWRQLAWMIPLAVAPTVYSAVYVYVRDQPDGCYNYIDVHNEEVGTLPASTAGVSAKVDRVYWQLSGRQFRRFMGTDWDGFIKKLHWVRTQIAYGHPFTDLFVLVLLLLGIDPPVGEWYGHVDVYAVSLLTVIGVAIAFRRSRVVGWLLIGLIVQSLLFVLLYHVFGQSADLLPVIFAGAVALGVLGSMLFPTGGRWISQLGACALAVGGGLHFTMNIPTQTHTIDASEYVQTLDLATFPGPALICGNWTMTVPMRYAQCVLTPRSDLHIVTSGSKLWIDRAIQIEDRPVYVAAVPESEGLCTTEPFRNVFRLDCSKARGITHDP